MIRVIECEQGSLEWHQARCGAITASMFSTIRKVVGGLTEQQEKYVAAVRDGLTKKDAAVVAGYKAAPKSESVEKAIKGEQVGDYSDAAKDYAFRLAWERISGQPLDEGFSTWAMKRGNELEPAARETHEEAIGMLIEHAGFVVTECGHYGASADGLINEDGGSEYKCLISPDRLRNILFDGDITEFTDQIQGCMWLTGRKWWHFCLYCPSLEPIGKHLIMHPVERDEDYIRALEQDLVRFNGLVERYRQRILDCPVSTLQMQKQEAA